MTKFFIYSLPHYIILYIPKLKAFADDKLDVAQIVKFALDREENILGKGENAGYQHFLIFLKCF